MKPWEMMRRRGAASTGGVGGIDPYWDKVVCLLHFDGSDGATAFVDAKGGTWTASGDAKITTSSPIVGTGSLLLDGTGDYITHASDSKFAFGTGDFCIEFDYVPTSLTNNHDIITFGANWDIYAAPNGQLLVWNGTANLFSTSTGYIVPGTRYRIALARKSGTLRLLLNGGVHSSASNTTNHSAAAFSVGLYPGNTARAACRIDELRITKGEGRYATAYTPAAGAFPDG